MTGDIAALDALRISLDPTGQLFIAGALFFIVLGVSLGLRLSDFRFFQSDPKLFLAGVFGQIIVLPAVTLLLIIAISPPPSIALGMLVVASCPGGTVSNMMVYYARGNVAYSVSLTAASSMIAAFFTPASILLWSNLYPPTATLLQTIPFSPLAFLAQTTALLAVPLCLGMIIAAQAPLSADRWRGRIAGFGTALLAAAVVYGTIQFFPQLIGATAILLPVTIVHNAVAFAVGGALGRIVGAREPERRTLLFEIGIQNSGLALVILLSQLDGVGGATAIAAVWGVWHLIAGGAIVWMFRYRDRKGLRQ